MKIEIEVFGIVLTDHQSEIMETDSPWTYNEYKPLPIKKCPCY